MAANGIEFYRNALKSATAIKAKTKGISQMEGLNEIREEKKKIKDTGKLNRPI